MKALVIYGTRYGNTQRVAEAIGDGLKSAFAVEVLPIDGVSPVQVTGADLLVIGGPTEAHGTTPALKAFIDGMSFALVHEQKITAPISSGFRPAPSSAACAAWKEMCSSRRSV